MMRSASRMQKKTRIMQRGSYQDNGLFWVRDGTVILKVEYVDTFSELGTGKPDDAG